jgi:hypothetical protein
MPEHLLGGVRGQTVKKNAALHFGAPYIVTVDIKNFFPSITPTQVYSVWRNTLNCSPEIAEILTKPPLSEAVSRRGHPPAPFLQTSCSAASMLLSGLPAKLIKSDIRVGSMILSFRGISPET